MLASTHALANPKGKQLFQTYCATCHGQAGLGDGPAAASLPEDKKPRNLTNPKTYKNGPDVASIMKTLETGIPGTLMVSWKAAIPKEADRKAIAEYVKSLQK